jgi:hypothetical protein
VIKFCGNNNETGHPVLGIGLTRDECEKLLQGQPILFGTESMPGLLHMEVFIMGGEDETVMARNMLTHGAIAPDQIHEDQSLAEPNVRPDKDVN